MAFDLNSTKSGLECAEDLNDFVHIDVLTHREESKGTISESDIPASDAILDNESDMEQEELSSEDEPIHVISEISK